MKNIIIVIVAAFLFTTNLFAQRSDYKVVFDMSTRDSISQQAVIREVQLIKDNNPDARMEVVVYGQGINLVLKNKSTQVASLSNLAAGKNIEFAVCAFTLKRLGIQEGDLVAGVKVVPDGIYEIISKQRDGWGYIKVAH